MGTEDRWHYLEINIDENTHKITKLEERVDRSFQMLDHMITDCIMLNDRISRLESRIDNDIGNLALKQGEVWGSLSKRIDAVCAHADHINRMLQADTVRVTDRLENMIGEDCERFTDHQKVMAEFALKVTHSLLLLTERLSNKKE